MIESERQENLKTVLTATPVRGFWEVIVGSYFVVAVPPGRARLHVKTIEVVNFAGKRK